MSGPLIAVPLLVLGSLAVQDRRADAIEEDKKERTRVLVLSGQRHLEFGLERRKKGLTLQAAAQIPLAVEASQGRNETAEFVLNLMRAYQDEFWKRKLEKPTRERIEIYEKRAQKLRQQDQEERLGLVRWAERMHLEEQAYEELRELLLE